MDLMSKMQELVKELNEASDAYYSGDRELMSDHEWNDKFDELTKLETESGIVLEDSPTKNISSFRSSGDKVKHEFPALSLPKSKDVADVVKWADNRPVDLSWKLDGMTLVAYYDNGRLTKLITRGDGTKGDDITHFASAIYNLKLEIPYEKHLVIRGEAVISYNSFEKFNEQHDYAYENPRNLTAGSLNPKSDISLVRERSITWIPFTLVYMPDEDNIISWRERMYFLQKLGFATVEFDHIEKADEIEAYIKSWSEQESIDNMIYPVDGLVVVYDDTEYASHGTLTGHHDTRGGYAFKWKDEEKDTVLSHIEWSVSVNSINPVAVFEPVRLEGTTVKRASLCNISECRRLGIGNTGTKLTVIKANKIIPKVIKAVKNGELCIPETCPVCGSKTEIRRSLDTGIETLICTNENCSAKNIRKMSRFVSKFGLDIQGLSDKTLEDLVNSGFIKSVCDIMTIPEREADLRAFFETAQGWGDRSISNLVKSVKKARSGVSADKLLYSLCIPSIGRDASKRLTANYTIPEITDFALKHDLTALIGTGIGTVASDDLIKWINVEYNAKLVSGLVTSCNVTYPVKNTGNAIFENVTFVVTGSLENYKSRDILKEEIENFGGKVAGSVSKNTNYLINNDVESSSSKNKKAKELGIPIISEAQYIKLKDELLAK